MGVPVALQVAVVGRCAVVIAAVVFAVVGYVVRNEVGMAVVVGVDAAAHPFFPFPPVYHHHSFFPSLILLLLHRFPSLLLVPGTCRNPTEEN